MLVLRTGPKRWSFLLLLVFPRVESWLFLPRGKLGFFDVYTGNLARFRQKVTNLSSRARVTLTNSETGVPSVTSATIRLRAVYGLSYPASIQLTPVLHLGFLGFPERFLPKNSDNSGQEGAPRVVYPGCSRAG